MKTNIFIASFELIEADISVIKLVGVEPLSKPMLGYCQLDP